MNELLIVDLIRLLVIFEAVVSFTITLGTLIVFTRSTYLTNGRRRYLLTHVAGMAIVFCTMCVYAVVEMFSRYGDFMSWRTPMLFLMFTISTVWLYQLYTFQLRQETKS